MLNADQAILFRAPRRVHLLTNAPPTLTPEFETLQQKRTKTDATKSERQNEDQILIRFSTKRVSW